VYAGVYQTKDAAKRAGRLADLLRCSLLRPMQTLRWASAASYQQAQMFRDARSCNGLLAKDPNNLGMLLLLADYYGEKASNWIKRKRMPKKAAGLADTRQSRKAWQKINGSKRRRCKKELR